MKKLHYCFTDEKIDRELIDDYLEVNSTKGCPWHRAMRPFVGGITSLKEYFSDSKKIAHDQRNYNINFNNSHLTAKFCPAISDILNDSIIIKCPTDIHISLFKDNDYFWNTPDQSYNPIAIQCHTTNQFYTDDPETNVFDGKINVKFILPINVRSDVPYVFLQPMYHKSQPWTVVNGSIRKNTVQPLNINTFFNTPADQDDYFISAGTPLAYMWFPERVKMNYKPNLHQSMRKRFIPKL